MGACLAKDSRVVSTSSERKHGFRSSHLTDGRDQENSLTFNAQFSHRHPPPSVLVQPVKTSNGTQPKGVLQMNTLNAAANRSHFFRTNRNSSNRSSNPQDAVAASMNALVYNELMPLSVGTPGAESVASIANHVPLNRPPGFGSPVSMAANNSHFLNESNPTSRQTRKFSNFLFSFGQSLIGSKGSDPLPYEAVAPANIRPPGEVTRSSKEEPSTPQLYAQQPWAPQPTPTMLLQQQQVARIAADSTLGGSNFNSQSSVRHPSRFQRDSRVAQIRPVALKALPVPQKRVTESKASQEAPKLTIAAPASAALLSSPLWLLSALPASAFEFNGYAGSMNSYYVTLGLFIMTVPGIYSLVKRSPKSKIKRKVYSVPGPKAAEGAKELDVWAKTIAAYFRKYNYRIVGTGEVITFEGTYQASTSQAFAISTYTLFSLASVALVLATIFPEIGNWWYSMCLVSPFAGYYYWTNGTRNEQVKVKMVTDDTDENTDIIIEGDDEEIDRFRTELDLVEKGKVRVKGILEQA